MYAPGCRARRAPDHPDPRQGSGFQQSKERMSRYPTSGSAAIGITRYISTGFQRQLNIALVHHTEEGNEKGVQLCIWAGADPHTPAPSFRFPSDLNDDNGEKDEEDRFLGWSAIEEACRTGNVEILERLRPHPSRDSFDELYRTARTGYVVKFLARLALPKDSGEVIQSQLRWLEIPPFGQLRSVDTLRSLFEVGIRWETSSEELMAWVRRSLLAADRRDGERLADSGPLDGS